MSALVRIGCLAAAGFLFLAPDRASDLNAQSLSERIDRAVQAELTAADVPVSPIADDAEFLRRVYLDLLGVIPPADRAVVFLESTDADKRARLIDELLADARYGRYQGDTWGPMLILEKSFVRPPKAGFFDWLSEQFNNNRPWNEVVYQLLAATGESAETNPEVAFLANELRTISPELATNLITSRFLGVSIECAQCHRHPFADWTEEDYWGVANFFMNYRRTKTAGVISRMQGLMYTVKNNRASIPSPKAAPMFLGGETPTIEEGVDPRFVFARWATADDNPYFARAMTNRMWSHFFGRGLVHPIEDMAGRDPTHPALLDLLTAEFVQSGFDLKSLIRAICNSQAYQRTSRVVTGNEDDAELYSHMPVKMMTPQQLWNSYEALGLEISTIPSPNVKSLLSPEEFRTYILNGDEQIDALEYKQGAAHALFLMNHLHLAAQQKVLADELAKEATPSEVIDSIYLTLLARYPTAAQKETLETLLQAKVAESEASAPEVYGDILWALLHSSEFIVNH